MVDLICSNCLYIGTPRKIKRGKPMSWFLFPVNIVHMIIRTFFNKQSVCRHCGETMLLTLDSPIGNKLYNSINDDVSESSLAQSKPEPTRTKEQFTKKLTEKSIKEETPPPASSHDVIDIENIETDNTPAPLPQRPTGITTQQDPNDW